MNERSGQAARGRYFAHVAINGSVATEYVTYTGAGGTHYSVEPQRFEASLLGDADLDGYARCLIPRDWNRA